MHRLAQQGIQTRPLWQPLHQSPAYTQAEGYGGDVASRINRMALSLPCSTGITESEIQTVVESIRSRPE